MNIYLYYRYILISNIHFREKEDNSKKISKNCPSLLHYLSVLTLTGNMKITEVAGHIEPPPTFTTVLERI